MRKANPLKIQSFTWVIALLLITVVAGACSATTSQNGIVDLSEVKNGVEIELVDFGFKPEEVVLTKDEPITFVFKNTSSQLHDYTIEQLGISVEVEANETVAYRFTPKRAGEFQVTCLVPGHISEGMVGKLIVKK